MRRTLIVSSIGIHIAIVAGLGLVGAWHLDQLELVKAPVDLHVAMAPPAESAGSPPRPATPFQHKQRDKPKVTVQPPDHATPATPAAPEVASATTTTGTGTGEGSAAGTGTGSGSGASESPCTADCGPPEHHEAVPEQQIIPPQLLSGLRISGETQLQPPDVVKTAMHRAGSSRVIASFQVCLDTAGTVASTRQLKPSGYAGYDAVLAQGLATWRYKPFTMNGRGIAVCSVVTFIYSMK
ncbi:hypothetical protein BH11MYX1_BH11MYX1_55480 [soil metagenome]